MSQQSDASKKKTDEPTEDAPEEDEKVQTKLYIQRCYVCNRLESDTSKKIYCSVKLLLFYRKKKKLKTRLKNQKQKMR